MNSIGYGDSPLSHKNQTADLPARGIAGQLHHNALAVRLPALDFDADAAGAHKVDAAARRERDFVRAGDFRLRKGCPHEVVQVVFALLDGGADAAQCVEDFCERIHL